MASGGSTHEKRTCRVPAAFVCLERSGRMVDIPPGDCILEEDQNFVAICWETSAGRQRAEVASESVRELIRWGKLTLGPLVSRG
jgi:hypothetical protein